VAMVLLTIWVALSYERIEFALTPATCNNYACVCDAYYKPLLWWISQCLKLSE